MIPSNQNAPTSKEWLLAILYLLGILGLGYKVVQYDIWGILLYWMPCLIVLTLWLLIGKTFNLRFFLVIGILARFLLVFSFPNLSDDIYRFYWDGILWTQGINPLSHPPSFYMQAGEAIPGLTPALYRELNSPEYFTIYPPVLQALFGFAAYVTNSISAFTILIKMIMFLFEVGTIYFIFKLLGQLKSDKVHAMWYVLNPLIILEIMGNVHFEGAMIFFLAAGLYYLFKGRNHLGAVNFALSIGSKLLPLMFFPATIRFLGIKKGLIWAFSGGVLFLLFCLPFFDEILIQNFLQSIDLYFRKFEFNASAYYLAREIGFYLTGYNQIAIIGPALAFFAIIGIIYLAFLKKWKGFEAYLLVLLYSFLFYLISSATVHPWYLAIPILLSVFTGQRFVIVWSLTAILSYSHYNRGLYEEHYALIFLEYLIPLAVFIWDYSKKPSNDVEHDTYHST